MSEPGPGHLLLDPHHDDSQLYLADEAPRLGSTVTVRVRTSARAPATAVWLRSVEDGEPFYPLCEVDREDRHGVWWQADLRMRNPWSATGSWSSRTPTATTSG